MALFKCKFCQRISEDRTSLLGHVTNAHYVNLIEEVYNLDDGETPKEQQSKALKEEGQTTDKQSKEYVMKQ